jgi:alpha-L-fucosidase
VAAYYYNRARAWGREVSVSTKYVAFAPSNDDSRQIGSIVDFEKIGKRSPAGIRAAPWMVDDTIGSTWGYTEGMAVSGGPAIVRRLVDTVSKDGFYMLNLSPKADGTIPPDQQRTLLEVGAWLDVNGAAIYGSHAWIRFGEGDWRFTVRDGALYAIGPASGAAAPIAALTPQQGRVDKVELLGRDGALQFRQDARGLAVDMPSLPAGAMPVTLKISGLGLR